MLFSCSEYQKVLNKGTTADQYKMATEMYEDQKFMKAIALFEKITDNYKGKPQMERIQYMVAQSHFNTKQYTLAAYYFEKFAQNYPKSSKLEEADFLGAKSHYMSSPVFSLDQEDTQSAITALQNFIYAFPESEKVVEANDNIRELTRKLEKKSYEIAWQYYHTEDYIAAITAFDNLLADYLGTSFKEDALYHKFLSAYELGMNSFITRKEERLRDALKFHERFKKSFPESEYLKETEKKVTEISNELNAVIALNIENNGS
jgi:outer membrane protein assembly factor BamD